MSRSRPDARRRWWRRLGPRWRARPTRDGWWFLFAVIGLGLAAANTGNNLVYLLYAMLLALIVVSGVLSEQTMRGVTLAPIFPEEIYAGRPALFGARLTNEKRWRSSYLLEVDVLDAPVRGRRAPAPARCLRVSRLEPGAERLLTWEATLPARGRRRLPGVRVKTRFPFGLAVKTGPVLLDAEVVVFPAVGPVSPELLRRAGGDGETARRRRGRGHDLYNLRQYRPGDDPRLIHWRSSAKASALTVRELEDEAALDMRLVLDGPGADRARLESGLSEAASLAVHLLRRGAAVELAGRGILVPLGRGRGQERTLLTALALYDPAADPALARAAPAPSLPPAGRPFAPLRELRLWLP